jgi:hypothetical protein
LHIGQILKGVAAVPSKRNHAFTLLHGEVLTLQIHPGSTHGAVDVLEQGQQRPFLQYLRTPVQPLLRVKSQEIECYIYSPEVSALLSWV